uniref:Uncharacterized protein n=1 Tax=Anguilla anguilla TaxID=7936 RepID=A0A0E9URF6_ANGAN
MPDSFERWTYILRRMPIKIFCPQQTNTSVSESRMTAYSCLLDSI